MYIIQKSGEIPRENITDLCPQLTKITIGSRAIMEIEPTAKYFFAQIEESY